LRRRPSRRHRAHRRTAGIRTWPVGRLQGAEKSRAGGFDSEIPGRKDSAAKTARSIVGKVTISLTHSAKKRTRSLVRRVATGLAVVALGLSVAAPAGAAEPAGGKTECRDVRTPVKFTGGSGHIAGTLCVPP